MSKGCQNSQSSESESELAQVSPHPLKSTLLADRIVASNSLLEQVPGDVKLRASLSELVDVPAQHCAGLIFLLLFHVVVVTVVPLFEGFAGQPCVVECCEKYKSFKLLIPQPDSERRHSPDFGTLMR